MITHNFFLLSIFKEAFILVFHKTIKTLEENIEKKIQKLCTYDNIIVM
ncbi:conserved hypothetical protein [Clostridium novyi NT]|uniref:Uncharacterized protein n=1 Tax=Clostridium novyi (strain NT) TaxID=386415 RepID=A0PYI5_CLONN|nr:conserved hypothetical protein [Clostridium novyi NT]